MKHKAIIFDCDGVLIDSEVLSNQTDVELLAELGIHLELSDYMQRFVGKSAKDVVAGVEQLLGHKLPADFSQRKETRVLVAFDRELKATPEIHTLLDHLAGLQTPVAVASGSSIKRLHHSLGLTGLQRYFGPHIYSAQMVERGKPAPDLFWLTAKHLGVEARNCLVIEDSLSGIVAAVAAGMTAIGFVGGSHIGPGHAERLLGSGALEVMAEMPKVLEWVQTQWLIN